MRLLGWWRAWPSDVRLGYAAVGYFALQAGLSVAAGPNLLLMLFECLGGRPLAFLGGARWR